MPRNQLLGKSLKDILNPLKRWYLPIVFALGIVIGCLCMWIYFENHIVTDSVKQIREGQQGLINPLLAIDQPEGLSQDEDTALKTRVNSIIETAESQNKATDVSVYFKGPKAQWFGIGIDKTYDPGSLLKIPVMIAYLKLAETNPEILNQQITYHETTDLNTWETIKPAIALVSGKSYSVNELISLMILYSDNNAAVLLSSLLNENYLNEVYTDLGLDVPPDQNTKISPKEYSIFFRVLYNSTYLSKVASEQALELLTQTAYKDGIVAGVPDGVKVAHKFGEAIDTDSSGAVSGRELHDCGFVYPANHTYLLCVMTRGNAIPDLQTVIQDISKEVYKNVMSQS